MSFHPRSLLFCSLLGLLPSVSRAADDALTTMAQDYAGTVRSIDGDLDRLMAMDRKCLSQDIVYDPSNMASHYKTLARMAQADRMAQMDQALLTMGQQLALGKSKLDETVQRISSARDALTKLTQPDALKVTGVDACTGGDAAQAQVIATSQIQVDKAKFALSLDSDTHAKKVPKVSSIITQFRTVVSQRVNEDHFTDLIKACMGPSYTATISTMQHGLKQMEQLQQYAQGAESAVGKMGGSLAAQATNMKKLGDCKSPVPDAAKTKPDANASTITGTPHANDAPAAAAAPGRAPSAEAPQAAKPAPSEPKLPDVGASPADASPSDTAAGRIKNQGDYFTDAPAGVPNATDLSQCYADPCSPGQVRAYQTAINQYISANHLPITPVAVDGVAGTQTANAWRAVMNTYNSGATNGDSYLAWGATSGTRNGTVYYTFPPGKITSTNQLSNFFQ